jgi:hypothetical protein
MTFGRNILFIACSILGLVAGCNGPHLDEYGVNSSVTLASSDPPIPTGHFEAVPGQANATNFSDVTFDSGNL